MWTTENKDDSIILKEIEDNLPPMWRLVETNVGRRGVVVTLTPFDNNTWRENFYVPTARNSRGSGSSPHFSHLGDSLAQDIIKAVSKSENFFKSFSDDIKILNEDYFRNVIGLAKSHIERNKRKRKQIAEGDRPTGQSSWGWDHGTGVSDPFLKIQIKSIDYELLREDFKSIATEKRNNLISIIFKEAKKGVYDDNKFEIVESLYEEIGRLVYASYDYKTFPEYQKIIAPALSFKGVPETAFLKYIKSVAPKDNFDVGRSRDGLSLRNHHTTVHSRDLLKDFGVLKYRSYTYDPYTFNSFSTKEKEQYFAIKELIPNLPKSGKQRKFIFELLDAILEKQSISKEDLNYAMTIFGRLGLPQHQSLFGTPPAQRQDIQKVVLDSSNKEKVQMLEEAITRTRGYNSEVLSEYKSLIETGQRLDSNQLKQIRAIFYRIGMKPQTNSFRKANLMRRSASEIIRNLENRVARLESNLNRTASMNREAAGKALLEGVRSSTAYHDGRPMEDASSCMLYFIGASENKSKFYEMIVEGSTVRILYGRLGSTGRSSDKSFMDSYDAERFFVKQLKAKLKKGYVSAFSLRGEHRKSGPLYGTYPIGLTSTPGPWQNQDVAYQTEMVEETLSAVENAILSFQDDGMIDERAIAMLVQAQRSLSMNRDQLSQEASDVIRVSLDRIQGTGRSGRQPIEVRTRTAIKGLKKLMRQLRGAMSGGHRRASYRN
jgi:predicted DNA-binding WGR domain protein